MKVLTVDKAHVVTICVLETVGEVGSVGITDKYCADGTHILEYDIDDEVSGQFYDGASFSRRRADSVCGFFFGVTI